MKFKVWDSKRKEFTSGPETFYFGEDGTLWDGWGGEELSKADPNYMPVYSTEIKDKNRIELFSGDICLSSSGKKYEIRFWDNMLAWMVYDFESDTYDLLSDISHRIEKIGTKFENPELLEPKK